MGLYPVFRCGVRTQPQSLGCNLRVEGADREIEFRVGSAIPKMDSFQVLVDTMIDRLGTSLKDEGLVPFGYPCSRDMQVITTVVLSDEDSHRAPHN